jgi:hypothetical protein
MPRVEILDNRCTCSRPTCPCLKEKPRKKLGREMGWCPRAAVVDVVNNIGGYVGYCLPCAEHALEEGSRRLRDD